MDLPLEDIFVVDLSRVLAGPYCTMMLGDLGAEVVKVEAPGRGDDTRAWGPPWAGGESAYYLCTNRNKRSITLNLQSSDGQRILRDLIDQADVVVENFKLGTMERWGLGYDALARRNPRLVYCALSGFGPTGPGRDLPGYDFLIQAMGGIMSITGEPDGEPMKVGVAIVDVTAGMLASSAILAALRVRDRTGQGQRIDLSLYEAQLAWLVNVASNYLIAGTPPRRYGNAHANVVPYQTFRARDRYFAVAVGNDAQFQHLCQTLGHPELATDERFATNPQRVDRRDELIPLLQAAFLTETADHWVEGLRAVGVPAGPINTVAQALEDPQAKARDMVVEVPHPTAGTVRLVGIPFKLSATPASIRRPPPLLGAHTDEVLRTRLGFTAETIAGLRRDGVIG